MIVQHFVVTVVMPEKDGCGNMNHPKTEGDVRMALDRVFGAECRELTVAETGK